MRASRAGTRGPGRRDLPGGPGVADEHASSTRPSRVSVSLSWRDAELDVDVTDDGRGPRSDAATARPGPGRHAGAGARLRRRAADRCRRGRRRLPGDGEPSAARGHRGSRWLSSPARPGCSSSTTRPLVRAGFADDPRRQPDLEVVGEAADGAEAVARRARTRPDVVLMDIRMPAWTASRRPRPSARGPGARVLMLTTFDLDEYVYERCGPGRAASCSRTCAAERTGRRGAGRRRRRRAARPDGDPPSDRPMWPRARGTARRPAPFDPERLAGLSPRETDTLRQLARGLSNAEIAAELTSPSTRSRPTSATCWPSSDCATGCRPWCWPTSPASSSPARLSLRSEPEVPLPGVPPGSRPPEHGRIPALRRVMMPRHRRRQYLAAATGRASAARCSWSWRGGSSSPHGFTVGLGSSTGL